MNIGGLRKQPTPGGVPVRIKSPGRSVMNWEHQAISSGVLKISWFVPMFERKYFFVIIGCVAMWVSDTVILVVFEGYDQNVSVYGVA